ncbi:MAG: RDD family protein [Leptospiraceae bacterium]|nr:RDD family protein [Leptospiraceae bacterium]
MGLDNSRSISIPEFWEVKYRTAGPVSRFLALLIDMVVCYLTLGLVILGGWALLLGLQALLVSMGVQISFEEFFKMTAFVQFMVFFVVFWGYFLLWEYFSRGRTPGKMILGLRVISLRGTGLNASHSVIRNMVRIGDMYPFLFSWWFFFVPSYFVAGLFLFITGKSFRRLGDIAAGTLVVRDLRGTRSTRRALEHARTDSSGIRPLASLSPNLMKAIHEYAVRRNTMNPIIRRDLADRFAPQVAEYFQIKRTFENNEEMMLAFYTFLFESTNPLSVDKNISI